VVDPGHDVKGAYLTGSKEFQWTGLIPGRRAADVYVYVLVKESCTRISLPRSRMDAQDGRVGIEITCCWTEVACGGKVMGDLWLRWNEVRRHIAPSCVWVKNCSRRSRNGSSLRTRYCNHLNI
jgi:hypothetical protein